MAVTNFLVSTLPAYVQDNQDILIKNFALVGRDTRAHIGIQTGVDFLRASNRCSPCMAGDAYIESH